MTVAKTVLLALGCFVLGLLLSRALGGPSDAELAESERLSSERARMGLLARAARVEADSSAEQSRVAVADAQAARRAIPKVRIKRDTVYIDGKPHAADSALADLVGKQVVALVKDSVAIAQLEATVVKKDLALVLYADSLNTISTALIDHQTSVIGRIQKPLLNVGAKKGLVVGVAIGLLTGLVLSR